MPRLARGNGPRGPAGSSAFDASALVGDVGKQERARELLAANDLYGASRLVFGLPEADTFTYHAVASVTLAQTQQAVQLGAANGLHAWYRRSDGSVVST